MRKIRLFPLILLLTLFLSLPAANAWAPEGFADAWEDLPEPVRALLPTDEAYLSGFYNARAYYVLMEAKDGIRTAYALWPFLTDDYYVALKSAPLPPIDGYGASIGSTSPIQLYLFYGAGDTCFTFARHPNEGTWLLVSVQGKGSFGISPIFGVVDYEQISEIHCLPGEMPDYNLATLDPRTLPKSLEDALAAVNTDGYAMVKSDVPTDRLHLRASPSKVAASIGRYYSGTPVRIHSVEGAWAKVSVCGVEGYMMTEFLATGRDMLKVNRYFPSLFLREEAAEKGVNMYLRPEAIDGLYVDTVGGDSGTSASELCILANVGDDWFHVVCPDGQTGYMESKYFWPGNG